MASASGEIVPQAARVRISMGVARPQNNRPSASQSSMVPSTSRGDATLLPDTAEKTLFELTTSEYYRKKTDKIPSRRGKRNSQEIEEASSPRILESRRPQLPEPVVTTSFGPRVEIENGRIVIKEATQDRTAGMDPSVDIDANDADCGTTYTSYRKRRKTPKWGIQETGRFFQALRQCGTDFTLMQAFFPGRTRAELKRKYQREDRAHPELVSMALNRSAPLDLTVFKLQFGNDTVAESLVNPETALTAVRSTSDNNASNTSMMPRENIYDESNKDEDDFIV